MLHKVIVTQPAVLDYLHLRGFVDPARLEYVFGGVLAEGRAAGVPPAASSRAGLRIGFAGNRYDPRGLDKGLDLFIDTIDALTAAGESVAAHLFGPWTSDDVGHARNRSRFHLRGLVDNDHLQATLAEMDICVFPTRAGVLGKGSLDGFPTGAAVEAALAGCAVLTTNPLRQQTPLVRGVDYIEIQPDVADIVARVRALTADPEALAKLKMSGRSAMNRVFGLEQQMRPRIMCLRSLLGIGEEP
jgi:glycosyltransferase involved in cell wall biosynthesis